MLEIYAAILLLNFVRDASPPLLDWQVIILALIGGGGVIVTIIGVIGAVIIDRVKTANAAHLVEVNKSLEGVRAEQVQDTNLSEALTNLADSTKGFLALLNKTATTAEDRNATQVRQAELMSVQNDYLDQLTQRVQKMTAEITDGRGEIIAKVSSKINDADIKASERHVEDAQLFSAVRADVAAVKSDLDEKAAEILRRLDDKPSVKGHQELARQFTELLTEIKLQLASIEARLPVIEPPRPTGVGTADAPTGEPKESEKPQ